MKAPAGYFVATDALGEMWIWRENGETPVGVVGYRDFRDDRTLWAYLTRDLPHLAEEES